MVCDTPCRNSGNKTPGRITPGRRARGEPVGSRSGTTVAGCLDLANQVEGRSQSGFAFLPLGRADFTRVGSDVLGSLDLAQQVGSVTADAFGGDFHSLDDAFRVNDEGAAVGQTLVFTQDFEVAADLHGRVADHGVLDLADGFGAVVPGLVGEVGV